MCIYIYIHTHIHIQYNYELPYFEWSPPWHSSDIVSDISSCSIYGINIPTSIWHSFWYILWHDFIWHFFWRSFWHLFWHSVSHIFWHSDRHSIVSRRGFRSRRAWLHPALAIEFGSLRAQLYPELAIWLGSIDAHSHDELAEEEMRRKKRTRRRSCTFVKIYIVTPHLVTWQVGKWYV